MISRVKGVEKVGTSLSLTKHDSRNQQGQSKNNKNQNFDGLLKDEINKNEDKGMKKVLKP